MKPIIEIAEIFNVTKSAVYLWINKGLPHKKERLIGKRERIIIDPEEVLKFLKLTNKDDYDV